MLTLVSACARPPFVSHHGPEALGAHIATYAVLNHAVAASPSVDHLFDRSIHETMERRGYALASRSEADLLVSYKMLLMPIGDHGAIEGAIGVDAASAGGGVRKVVLVTLEEARTDRVLWVGWSLGEYPDHEIIRRTADSLTQILARLPSRAMQPVGQQTWEKSDEATH